MTKKEPWHYDAIKGRPAWSKELGRQRVIERQLENDRKAAAEQKPVRRSA